MEQVKKEHSFMLKLATFIVDKRNLFFLITIIALIFSAFSRNWVEVENSLSFYLPEESETKQALDVMADQFTTYGTAQVMVANITYNEASDLNERIAQVKGVQSIAFDQTTEHYAHSSALFTVTFDYDETDDQCLASLDAVKELLSDYDIYVSTELGDTLAETIDAEVNVIMVYVAVIVVAVLILTSRTYGEVPVLLLTFITAMILNQGTNFLLGKISFVSNSVTSILQLALSLDYAVILCNRFKEEHRLLARHCRPQQGYPGDQCQLADHRWRSVRHAIYAVQDRTGHGHLPDEVNSLCTAVCLCGHAGIAGIVRAFDRKDRASGLYPENLFRRKICVGKP